LFSSAAVEILFFENITFYAQLMAFVETIDSP